MFATLHTQDTPQTIDRIIDVFPPSQQHQVRVQLSVALQGIVTQQLLPTADGRGARLRRRCSSPPRRCETSSARARRTRSTPSCRPAPARGSKQAVSDQLKARGLIVLDIAAKRGSKELTLELFKRVKARDLTIMSRQLASMVSSGVTILRALYVLEEQTESKMLKQALVQIHKDVEAGLPLSDAFERHPKVFNPLYVAMVRSGEAGGMLEDALMRTADQLEKEDALRRQVRSAMVYPTVVISFALVILLALVAFIVPVFAKVFKDFAASFPHSPR